MASTLNPSGGLNFGFYDQSRARARTRTRDAAVVAPRRRRAAGQARRDEAARDRTAGDRAARVRRRERLRAPIPLAPPRAPNGPGVAGRWARGMAFGHGALPASPR